MCYAPHHRHYVAELPPQGKPQSGCFQTKCFAFSLCNCPSFVCCRRHLPSKGKPLKGKFITKFFAEIFA